MKRTAVINVVGLTPSLVGTHTPRIAALRDAGAARPIHSMVPAVTCPVQSTYLTGTWPDQHGIVGNGWYFRDDGEVHFWRQSNRLVQAPKIWEKAREHDPGFTCANLFWWYNMYSTVDIAVTPRPMYPADGRKLPDLWCTPAEERRRLQDELGPFPLFKFWGPATSIESSRWIAEAAKQIDARHHPTLSLVYLPHLDYGLQKAGPAPSAIAADLAAVDGVVGDLIDYYRNLGIRVLLLSEYGVQPVNRPVHLNRAFRDQGWITLREELGRELLDCGASRCFAVADHQVAHVYVRDPSLLGAVQQQLESIDGVQSVIPRSGLHVHHLDHPRAGNFLALAEPDTWFTYYYWQDDRRAPDFARTVDIHRKPGYDPVELFVDPALRFPPLTIAAKLLRKKLGFRTLLDVVPLDASLVHGSHGVPPTDPTQGPMVISSEKDLLPGTPLRAVDIADAILRHLTQ